MITSDCPAVYQNAKLMVQQSSTLDRWHLISSHQLSAPMAQFRHLKYLHICVYQQQPFDFKSTWLRDLLESTSASENVTVVLDQHFREATFGDYTNSISWRPSYCANWPADEQAKFAETIHVSLATYWRATNDPKVSP